MKTISTKFPEVFVVVPNAFGDDRGYFFEAFNRRRYAELGIETDYDQDNVSFSTAGVVRGLHFQHPNGQAKLIQVLSGAVLDVAVDVRRGSPSFGEWVGVVLSAENHHQIMVPTGFAHGFAVIGDHALLSYKCKGFYEPARESTVLWNDPAVAIEWGVSNPIVSSKDAAGVLLADIPKDRLPTWGK